VFRSPLRPAFTRRVSLVAATFAVTCTSSESPSETKGAPVDVALSPYLGQLLTVDALVGSDSVRLIFDTGGGETVVSPAIAARLGCVPSGRSVGFRMNGDRVDVTFCPAVTLVLGGVSFAHDRIGVWDVQALLPEGAARVDGVLSLRTLATRPFTLRLAERRLTLETAASFRRQIEGMHRLRSRLATGSDGDELTVFVRGVVEDTAWFLVDSGNLDVVQVGPHLRGGGVAPAGQDGAWEAVLTLDGLPGVPATFRTRDIIYDGVLSEEFLRQWTLAFDLSVNGVWAAPRLGR